VTPARLAETVANALEASGEDTSRRASRSTLSGVEGAEPVLRIATLDDEAAVSALMKESADALFPRSYDERQSTSAVRYVAQVDPLLLADGTYFVLEHDGEPVACGGWSRRDRLYTGSGDSADDARALDPETEPARVRAMFVRADWTRRGLGRRILEECEAAARREGFRRLSLMSTLPGLPLYLAYGFQRLEDVEVVMPDGVTIACVSMEKPVAAEQRTRRG
jgi:GNAT superfamily N-acetyltransferase